MFCGAECLLTCVSTLILCVRSHSRFPTLKPTPLTCARDAEHVNFSQLVRPADWEIFVDALARAVLEEQSPQRLLQVRGKLYELLCNCIPPEMILRSLVLALLRRLDDQLRHETVQWAAYYEHRMQIGSKPIFHLEAFVAKFMALYKRWVVAAFQM